MWSWQPSVHGDLTLVWKANTLDQNNVSSHLTIERHCNTSRNVHFNVPSRPLLSLFSLPLESLILLCSTCPWSFSKSSVPCCWMLSTGHSWMWWRKTLIFLHQHSTYCPCFYPLSMIAVAHKSDEGSTGVTNPSGIRDAPGNVSGTKKASHCRLEKGKHSSLLQQTSWIRKKQKTKTKKKKQQNLHVRLASQFLLSTLSTTLMARHPAYNSITEFMITYRLNFLALPLAK